jgi:hypothetical protein
MIDSSIVMRRKGAVGVGFFQRPGGSGEGAAQNLSNSPDKTDVEIITEAESNDHAEIDGCSFRNAFLA